VRRPLSCKKHSNCDGQPAGHWPTFWQVEQLKQWAHHKVCHQTVCHQNPSAVSSIQFSSVQFSWPIRFTLEALRVWVMELQKRSRRKTWKLKPLLCVRVWKRSVRAIKGNKQNHNRIISFMQQPIKSNERSNGIFCRAVVYSAKQWG